jgi:hypothetical protein
LQKAQPSRLGFLLVQRVAQVWDKGIWVPQVSLFEQMQRQKP